MIRWWIFIIPWILMISVLGEFGIIQRCGVIVMELFAFELWRRIAFGVGIDITVSESISCLFHQL
jgi:hypothetical protein